MDIVIAALFGVVQGLTEFLPISSSGHLVILHDLFNIQSINDIGFDVALHVGTLLSLLAFFYNDLIKLAGGFMRSLSGWNIKEDKEQRLSWAIIIGTIPAAVIGYSLENTIVANARSVVVVAWALIIIGIMFFLMEKYASQKDEIETVGMNRGLLIGLAQAVALIPGVSRSGITIITGLGLDLKREAAARFSFLLSIPIVFGAGLKKFLDLMEVGGGTDWVLYGVGCVAAAVTGFIAIKYFLKFVQGHTLKGFGLYRILLGIVLLILL